MIVCICHRISESDIERAAAAGCMSFEELQSVTNSVTDCGACRECIEKIFLGAVRQPAAGMPRAEAPIQPIDASTAP